MSHSKLAAKPASPSSKPVVPNGPSTTGKPSGKGRGNLKPRKK
ncbi:hypothetical protein [Chryseobacterium sp. Leaf394]|nr:hypothetical protein [Chryseobacterium sp. Leaf394]